MVVSVCDGMQGLGMMNHGLKNGENGETGEKGVKSGMARGDDW